jgi:hypothetical protein
MKLIAEPTDVAALLDAAADVFDTLDIARGHWSRAADSREVEVDSPDVVAVCMVGAMRRVGGKAPWQVRSEARGVMRGVLYGRGPTVGLNRSLTKWSDAHSREQVQAMLRAGAAKAREATRAVRG